MSESSFRMVREQVARNSRTSPEVLVRLAADRDAGVMSRVAANPATPPDTLGRLAGADVVTRLAVARNPGTTAGVLAWLAGVESGDVRGAAVRGWLDKVLASSGAAELYAAVGEDPLEWDEDRQRQLLRELGEDA